MEAIDDTMTEAVAMEVLVDTIGRMIAMTDMTDTIDTIEEILAATELETKQKQSSFFYLANVTLLFPKPLNIIFFH